MASLTSFSMFTSFPLDIQALILDQCPAEDQICLRLASRTLWSLSILRKSIPPLHYTGMVLCGTEQAEDNDPSMSVQSTFYRRPHRHARKVNCHVLSLTKLKVCDVSHQYLVQAADNADLG